MLRIGVTGTDTGVGKTVVSVALLAMLREEGLRVAAMKPVETGVERGVPDSDTARLRAAAGSEDPETLVCPIVLPEPLAPWIAARRAGVTIDPSELDAPFEALSRGRDAVLVEGAGGLLVPLTGEVAFDTLFRRWDAEVILVAADRLGVLNHTRLTVAVAEAAGLTVRGVVLNSGPDPHAGAVSPGDPQEPARETNLDVLRELIPHVPIVHFPRLEDPWDASRAAEVARECGLRALLPSQEAVEGGPPKGEGGRHRAPPRDT